MRGPVCRLLTCVRSEPPVSEVEIAAKLERLHWPSYLCHERMPIHCGDAL